ncbi:olfactory receptor 10A7-like [Hyla sarda]|uniref:olfactory receptor 10A7-like n=1 Tax=Hyla sarda TaxID=327740 RepID=UPI0024C43D8B|nr:olfactory receptor 10A7-like [Hyla sarda]
MNIHSTNVSLVTEIILLGFQNIQNLRIFFFLLLLAIFCVTLCGNLLIIVVVSYSRSLHSPMYFFLTQLAFSDILLSTSIVPNLLSLILYEGRSVSFVGCLTQFYFFTASGELECLLLAVMSYDRYQAICNPLHYATVMDLAFCLKAIVAFWMIILAIALMFSITMSYLWFCGPNVIDHFFCDFDPILELSCSDTFIIKTEGLFLVLPLIIFPFTLIMISYISIIVTILKMSSVTMRYKTFSTSGSHLAVVSMYYGSLFSMYSFKNWESEKKILSLLYTVVTPLLNPMIYSLSNNEMKKVIKILFRKISTFFCQQENTIWSI